jgi:hypothetical protein
MQKIEKKMLPHKGKVCLQTFNGKLERLLAPEEESSGGLKISLHVSLQMSLIALIFRGAL